MCLEFLDINFKSQSKNILILSLYKCLEITYLGLRLLKKEALFFCY